eukprot:15472253-Alexandrium_andersonii.AAC.1
MGAPHSAKPGREGGPGLNFRRGQDLWPPPPPRPQGLLQQGGDPAASGRRGRWPRPPCAGATCGDRRRE